MTLSGPWESDSGARQPESYREKVACVTSIQLASTTGRISTAPHSVHSEGGPAATSYSKRGITPTVEGFSELRTCSERTSQFRGAMLPLHYETDRLKSKSWGSLDIPHRMSS